MSQTLIRVLVHLIFSTKRRQPLITPEIEPELFAYMGGICRAHGSPLLAAGGTADHVHLLVALSKTVAISDLLMDVKKDSSKWIKTKGSHLGAFRWQDGYGAFSIGESQVSAVKGYLARQKQHHKRVSFQEEFLAFLKKYNVEYDPRYIWD